MKLVSKITNMDDLNIISNYSDFIMLPYDLINTLNVNKIIELNKTPILMYNLMVHPFEINDLKNELLSYKELNVLYYVTDLGLARILKENELISKTIYDPVTMITNSLDAANYFNYGFNAISLSNEITIKDLCKIISKTNVTVFYQVFGHRLMLHSRRKLVSLYGEKINVDIDKSNMRIVEATRNDSYPIVENNRGTYIYRSYLISLLKELKDIDLEYAYLESFNVKTDIYIKVLDIFNKYLCDEYTLNQALEHMSLLNLDIKDGFSYQDSIYNKEEF